MRQSLTPEDERHLMVRSLSIDYAAGGSEERHAHAWPQFLYARSGAIRIEAGGKWWTIPPRRGLWIPAHVDHSLRMSSRLQLRTLYFSPALAKVHAEIEVADVSGLLHEVILRVCEQDILDARNPADINLYSIILNELERRDPSVVALTLPRDPRAHKLARIFLGGQANNEGMGALCLEAGLSRRTAERLFQKETGLTPGQWRRFAALSESLIRLAGGERIESAAISAGYESRSAFSEAFTRTFGTTPSHVRSTV